MILSRSTLARILTHARDSDLDELTPFIVETTQCYRIDRPLRLAHFLGQVGHESWHLLYREEIASGAAYEGRRGLGNTQPGDGKRFKGRGLIQLTGRTNYTAYDKARRLNGQLLTHPNRVADDPSLCVDVAGWFWDTHNLNLYADRDDVRQVTRRINGGYNGLRDRQALTTRAKAILVQSALNMLSHARLMIDGVIGPKTTEAVYSFKKQNGLMVSSAFDTAFWNTLALKLDEQQRAV